MIKNRNKNWALIYWIGALLQIAIICIIKIILRLYIIEYHSVIDTIFLAVGGTSTALWGVIVSRKSLRVSNFKDILLDFFSVRQPIKYYVTTIIPLILIFFTQLMRGRTIDDITIKKFLILFLIAILFGGIEEIGWRYTFQPLIEIKYPFEIACLITFVSWGTWHYMYYYITDVVKQINHIPFLLGLLTSSFVLGAIYHTSHSLWLCVWYHAMLNALSQSLIAPALSQTIVTTLLGIIFSIIIVRRPQSISLMSIWRIKDGKRDKTSRF